jgi:hypothetical protein
MVVACGGLTPAAFAIDCHDRAVLASLEQNSSVGGFLHTLSVSPTTA